jgi:hypothetical protein
MKDIFGSSIECVYDCFYLYKGNKIEKNHFWGYGFTYTNILDPSINVISKNTLEKIKNKYYNLIIYSFVSRNSYMLDEVINITNGKNVILINGEDDFGRFDFYTNKTLYFKRELAEKKEKNIFPIHYAIHESKIYDKTNIKTKTLSDSVPTMDNCTNISSSNYIFNNEADYYYDYQISKYGITTKKGGWDCMRHYEILANKCIPLFQNLVACPELTLTNLPKKTLLEINETYPDISETKYEYFLNELFEFTKNNLTTRKLAEYILSFYI